MVRQSLTIAKTSLLLLISFVVLIVIFSYYHSTVRGTENKFANVHLNKSKAGSIVKIVHQSWKTNKLPKRFEKWSQSWRLCYPNWSHQFWTNKDNRVLVQLHFPWFLKTYDTLPFDINRADAARYVYLFLQGGIYADLDAECLQPFPHLLDGFELVFGAMVGQYGSSIREGYTQNSFMYSTARHPFWIEMLHGIMAFKGSSGSIESFTGPILLVNTINSYRQRFPSAVKIYPPKYFNPFSWLKQKETSIKNCRVNNAMTDEDINRCRAFYNESYVLQYHSHSWGNVKME